MKNFDEWNKKKKEINECTGPKFFKEREIWITFCGVNVGIEQDGNEYNFVRPVLVYRKYNGRQFLGIPLTTKNKDNEYYVKIDDGGILRKESFAILSQMRSFDSRRLYRKIGILHYRNFLSIIKSAEWLTLPQGPIGHSDEIILIYLYFCVKYSLIENL